MFNKVDPRAKILIVLALTSVIIFTKNIWIMIGITILSLIYSWLFKVDLYQVFFKLRKFLTLLIGLIFIQSIFNTNGNVLIGVGEFKLLTDVGLILGISYICRVIVIIMSGSIISSSTMRENLQGLYQMKLPYEIGLMTSVGIRFLPILMEEVNNAYIAMELRGINVKKLKISLRIKIIAQLFVPIIYSTMIRAQKLSESIEARGFVIGKARSSYMVLKFKRNDVIVTILCVSIVILVVIGGGII